MGLGKTGIACVRFLVKQGLAVCVMDSRPNPPGFSTLLQEFPQVAYTVGSFNTEQLLNADEIIISPGISLQESALAQALAAGVPVVSEIELFARSVNAPVIAITGSNGKSTVTTLVGNMAAQAGWSVKIGGNLGTPALDLLCTPAPQLYVLELSSFQLETTYSLNPKAAVVLNISEDHMDRYNSLAEYAAVKQRIYQGEGTVIINADDPYVVAMLPPHRHHLSFSLRCDRSSFSVCQRRGELYLARVIDHSFDLLLPVNAMRLQSAIMRANVLAALALGEAVNIPMSAMLDAIQDFHGLPHRCAWVGRIGEIDWFNDSKGTNVGASIAAIQGLEKPGQIVLIAGGQGKGADFAPFAEVVIEHCRACVLIGQDAPLIEAALDNHLPLSHAHNMQEAVLQAAAFANPGDAVLLSPACASLDMFNNYEHRGQVFTEAVELFFNSASNIL